MCKTDHLCVMQVVAFNVVCVQCVCNASEVVLHQRNVPDLPVPLRNACRVDTTLYVKAVYLKCI